MPDFCIRADNCRTMQICRRCNWCSLVDPDIGKIGLIWTASGNLRLTLAWQEKNVGFLLRKVWRKRLWFLFVRRARCPALVIGILWTVSGIAEALLFRTNGKFPADGLAGACSKDSPLKTSVSEQSLAFPIEFPWYEADMLNSSAPTAYTSNRSLRILYDKGLGQYAPMYWHKWELPCCNWYFWCPWLRPEPGNFCEEVLRVEKQQPLVLFILSSKLLPKLP